MKLLALIVAGFAVVTGIRILADSDCSSVSFDGQGGRVAVANCYADSSGALPGGIAGGGLILIGILVFLFILRLRG